MKIDSKLKTRLAKAQADILAGKVTPKLREELEKLADEINAAGEGHEPLKQVVHGLRVAASAA